MKSFNEHVIFYAGFHRDPRNILTHVFGVPLIVFAVAVILSKPRFIFIDQWVTPAYFAAAFAALFYLRLNILTGLILTAYLALCVYLGAQISAMGWIAWLSFGIGLFIFGWILQFIGHHYEGKKPAFVDDLSGLLQGPLFLVVEGLFALGWNPKLHAEVINAVGPIRRREVVRQSA